MYSINYFIKQLNYNIESLISFTKSVKIEKSNLLITFLLKMQVLIQEIENVINKSVEKLFVQLIKKYPEIEKEELEKIWKTVSENTGEATSSKQISNKELPTKKIVEKIEKPIENKAEIPAKVSTSVKTGCPYEYIKGEVKGTICGAKLADGKAYCSRHKKHEGVVKKEKKIIPIPKASQKDKTELPENKTQIENSFSRALYKHKTLGCLHHTQTGLVFKSATERIVIGKIVNNEVVKLSDDDIELCKKWSFAFENPKKELQDSQESDSEIENKQETNHKKIYLTKSEKGKEKFLEIKRNNCTLYIREGKIGKIGTTEPMEYSSIEEASKEMEELVSKKIKKGYSIQSPSFMRANVKNGPNSESDSESVDDMIDEIQKSSSDEEEQDDKDINKKRDFIAGVLGLKPKSNSKNTSEIDDDE